MAARTNLAPGRNGLKLSDPRSTPPNPVLPSGARWVDEGQATNTVSGNTANQSFGFVSLPAIAAGRSSVTVNNTMVAANSIIRCWRQNQSADATALLEVDCWEGSNASRVAGTSFVMEYIAQGATMAQAWVGCYEIRGT